MKNDWEGRREAILVQLVFMEGLLGIVYFAAFLLLAV